MQITCPNCDHQWDTKLPRPGPLTCPQCQYRRRDPGRYPERQWLYAEKEKE